MTHAHGLSGYRHYGCRCDACRAAKNTAAQAYRQKRRNHLPICPSCGDFVHYTQFEARTGWCRLCTTTFAGASA